MSGKSPIDRWCVFLILAIMISWFPGCCGPCGCNPGHTERNGAAVQRDEQAADRLAAGQLNEGIGSMNCKECSVVDAKGRLAADPECVYLDVRTPEEFEPGHVAGALNVPILLTNRQTGMREPNPDFLRIVEAHLPKGRPIICGCKSGGRSAMAADLMIRAGYRDVTNMMGGFIGKPSPMGGMEIPGWAALGYPVSQDGMRYEDLEAQAGS